MTRHATKVATFVALVVTLMAVPKSAHAQLGWTFVGVGDFDTSNTYLVLGGLSVSPQRQGWSPLGAVNAYWLQYPSGTGHQNVTSVTPMVGLKDNFGTGAFQVKVGYAFANKDNVVPVINPLASGSGVTNGAQLDYWGTGAMTAQAIADYNYGSEAFWGRGRLGFRVARFTNGGVTVGPELAYLHSSTYHATRIGGVLGLTPGAGTTINAAIGRKNENGPNDATYFTFELVLFPH